MKEQLIKYVDLLFAGSPGNEDMKQEILQNTLDRYDDLIAQGKNPQAAYSLAISGIGDISEILQSSGSTRSEQAYYAPATQPEETEEQAEKKKLMRTISTALYILCPVPLFLIEDEIGLCLLLVTVAAATFLNRMGSTGNKPALEEAPQALTPKQELRRGVRGIIWAVGFALYFLVSFWTDAWHLTWLLFPLIAATQGLVIAIMDLKEANDHEG